MTNHLFELAGNRKTETVIPKSKKKWYQGKPVVSAAILILIVLGCLCAELIMTKDPSLVVNGNGYVSNDMRDRVRTPPQALRMLLRRPHLPGRTL